MVGKKWPKSSYQNGGEFNGDFHPQWDPVFFFFLDLSKSNLHSLKLTASLPLKIGLNAPQKETSRESLPTIPCFKGNVCWLRFREMKPTPKLEMKPSVFERLGVGRCFCWEKKNHFPGSLVPLKEFVVVLDGVLVEANKVPGNISIYICVYIYRYMQYMFNKKTFPLKLYGFECFLINGMPCLGLKIIESLQELITFFPPCRVAIPINWQTWRADIPL